MAKNLMLLTIVIFAFSIRLWRLDIVPPSLFSDEVDIAYQVKVFRSTGTDYYGNKFPIHFHSFVDWRTSAQIYSSVLVSYFTNNDIYIVRLPSVIFSVASVFVFYLITQSLTASFLLAISPWSIHYGRTGFEVSGMLLCLLLGLYFYQKQKNILSIIFTCLSVYFYSTAKLFILPFIVYLNFQDKLSIKKIFITTIILLPLLVDMFLGRAGYRFSYVSIFATPHLEQITDKLRYQDIPITRQNELGYKTTIYSKLFHNKYQLMTDQFINNYLSSFSPQFLFTKGDENIRHGFGNHGLMYTIDFLTVIIGIYLASKKISRLSKIMILILIIAPIPFCLTTDSFGPHATRLIVMMVPLIYFSSLTVNKYKIFIPIYILQAILFWHYYTVHYPQSSANVWHYNQMQVVLNINQYQDKNIYFSDKIEPFIPFFLNYYPYLNKLDIKNYDSNYFGGKTIDNKYFFGEINSNNTKSFPTGSILVVSDIQPVDTSTLKIIKIIPKVYEMAHSYTIYEKQN